jgi:hypothetical protein
MKITELLLAELDREAVGIRKTLERVPEGKNDWKPHEKSMPLGSLATIVATIPAWLDMVVNMDELDINPPGGPKFRPQEWKTRRDLLGQFEASLTRDARSCRRPRKSRSLECCFAFAQSKNRLPRLSHDLERCRPGHPHSEASQSGVRKAEVSRCKRRRRFCYSF